ncbi:MAG: MotA/TolQ/ExbB proton channel family protein, partial [Prosthecobacter sp.]
MIDLTSAAGPLELVSKGGPLVWLLLGCLCVSGAIFLERLTYFHRASMNVGEFLAGLATLISRRNFAEALQECVATRVPAGRVIHSALLRHHVPR